MILKKYKSEIVIDSNHCLRYVNIQSVNAEEIFYTIQQLGNLLLLCQNIAGARNVFVKLRIFQKIEKQKI